MTRLAAGSSDWFARAQQVMPGGVNSPVRSFRAVGGTPLFMGSGSGSRVYDIDGNEYLDLVGSWGPLILGHAHPAIVHAVRQAAAHSTSFGAPTCGEVELAERITEAVPSMEQVRLVNSGTEAAMSAIRVARGVTGRDKVMKFNGCYHGHADGLLVRAGSGAATHGVPTSAGVPASYAAETLVAEFNQLETVESLLRAYPGQVAAIIVEPVAGNMGVVAPEADFLPGLRSLADAHSTLLIFDEVITGFRLGYGGAQAHYQVVPDLTCLGKIIGGGLPVGAYGGRREYMAHVSPLGAVYQAGTLSGNPLAVAAGMACLEELRRPGTYETLEARAERLEQGLAHAADRAGAAVQITRVGSMLTPFFTTDTPRTWSDVAGTDTACYARFFRRMLDGGVALPPSPFEAAFLSLAHTAADVEFVVEQAAKALAAGPE